MSRTEQEQDDALIGTSVGGKYRVDRLIGRGGMGAVYAATNQDIGKRVALKFLDPAAATDSDSVVRFQREARAASAVESAHIVQIFDAGRYDERPYLVMELLRGEDLRGRLREHGRLPINEAVHITAQVLRGLARAHDAGIVHRDLKPDNVFLCARDDDPMFVKLVDFGISKIAHTGEKATTLTRRGTVLGTVFYMAPEQAQAQPDVDGRADLFSVGAILYEMLAGRPPHVGRAYEAVLIDICTKDAEDIRTHNEDVPDELAEVVKKALARDRDERFESARAFYDALARACPQLVTTPPPISGGHAEPALANTGETGVPTEQGQTLSGSHASRAHTRRTVVVGVIAAAAAFTATAVMMSRARSVDDDPNRPAAAPPASSSAAPATTGPVVEPATSASPPDETADAGARKAAEPKAKPRSAPGPVTKPPATAKKPAPTKPDPAKKDGTGVASGLQLKTSGP